MAALKSLTKFLRFIETQGYSLEGMTVFCYINEEVLKQADNVAFYKLANKMRCPLVIKGLAYSQNVNGMRFFVEFAGLISLQKTEFKIEKDDYYWDNADMILSSDKNKDLHFDVYRDFLSRADESYFSKSPFVVESTILDKILDGFVVNFGTRLLYQFK